MRKLWILLALAAAAAQVQANEVRKVEHAALPGGITVVSIGLAAPLARAPGVFRTFYPAQRLVLDLADASVAPGLKTIRPERSTVRAIQLVGYVPGTRLVIELAMPATYETELKGNDLVVTLRPLPPSSDKPRYFGEASR